MCVTQKKYEFSIHQILYDSLVVGDGAKSPSFIVVGTGASGIASAAKLLENGYSNVVMLEAQNRIGGRVNSVPFGKGYIDLGKIMFEIYVLDKTFYKLKNVGGQWCSGQFGNTVYELVKDDFQFGDNGIRSENTQCLNSNGNLIDRNKCAALMNLTEAITSDYKSMSMFNGSLGEFFKLNYQTGLEDKKFEDVDKELVDQIADLRHRQMNTLWATESWFELSAKLNSNNGAGDKVPSIFEIWLKFSGFFFIEGNQQLTWKEHGYLTILDFLMVFLIT